MPRLNGTRVVVTRPEHLATPLVDAIEAEGGEVTCFPTVIIEPLNRPEQLQSANKLVAEADIVILISRNAIEYAHQLLNNQLITQCTIAVIGQSSADTFKAMFQHPADVLPTLSFNSEGLLATAELQSEQIAGKRIVIIRGEGGREHLANRLKERGAIVDYLELYRRSIPEGAARKPEPDWNSGKISAVITTSNALLENLLAMTSPSQRDALLKTQQIVASTRGQKLAASLGFIYDAVVAENATTEALLQSLINWHQQKK